MARRKNSLLSMQRLLIAPSRIVCPVKFDGATELS